MTAGQVAVDVLLVSALVGLLWFVAWCGGRWGGP